MISRLYRGSLMTSEQNTIRLSHFSHLLYGFANSLTNEERIIIFTMRDKYAKLNYDIDWLSATASYEDEIERGKIQFSFMSEKKSELKEKIHRIRLRMTGEGVVASPDDTKTMDYLVNRYDEISSRVATITSHINLCQNEFYGFLYFPLIECLKKLKQLHENKKCKTDNCYCSEIYISNGCWDLSKMLLTICNSSHLVIADYDNFSKWNRNNIFCHPIISTIDNYVDYMTGITDTSNCASMILNDIEMSYFKVLVKKLIRFFIKHEKKVDPTIAKVMSINSTGFIIYSFVVGPELLIQILAGIGVYFFDDEKKRKFNY